MFTTNGLITEFVIDVENENVIAATNHVVFVGQKQEKVAE